MIREMKWHIYMINEEEGECPLLWEDECLEFDNEEAAKRFLKDVVDVFEDPNVLGEPEKIVIKETIQFWDGGYVNATNKTVIIVNEEEELVDFN